MTMIYAFLFSGVLCLIGQIIYDNTKLTPGHITSIYVIVGVLLYSFGIYEKCIEIFGGGAMTPITNFGYLLTKGAMEGAEESGFLGIFKGMLVPVSGTLSFVVIVSGIVALFAKPHP